MRKKIKEILNKEEGFTLVELLAVIVILGIIVAIAIPSIGGIISNTQKSANEAEKDLIVDAGRLYFTTSDNFTETEVGVDTLVSEGYLEDRGDADLPDGGVKKVTTDNVITYEFDPSITRTAGGS